MGIDDELPPLPGNEEIEDESLNDTPEETGEETVADEAPLEERGGKTATGKGEKPLTLREALLKAQKDAEGKDGQPKGKNDVPKDVKTGKFQKKDGAQAASATAAQQPVQPAVPNQQQPGVQQPAQVSTRFPKELQAELNKLPPAVIAQLNAREDATHRELTTATEDRKMGQDFGKTVAPYLAQIRSEGATPISAVANLFDMAYFLRNPAITPQAKGEFLWRTARQFGADMRQGQVQAVQQPFNPQLQAVTNQVQQLQQQIKQEQDSKKAAEQDAVNSQITAFKADTAAHPHFEVVALDMAAMLQAGRATSLQDAYEKACYANPEIRSIVLAADQKAAEEKRVADQKAKADAAKRAGSSVRGGPGQGANKNGKVVQKSLREELAAQFASHSEG